MFGLLLFSEFQRKSFGKREMPLYSVCVSFATGSAVAMFWQLSPGLGAVFSVGFENQLPASSCAASAIFKQHVGVGICSPTIRLGQR